MQAESLRYDSTKNQTRLFDRKTNAVPKAEQNQIILILL